MNLHRVASILLISVLLLTISTTLRAQTGSSDRESGLNAAREIISDMEKIVTPNGVQESFKAKIGGIDQWVSIRGKDRSNPVLLFIHGGPASPTMPVGWTFQRPWEEYFTVVQWDQRGAGKTYIANDPATVGPTLHVDRYVDDTLELIALLRQKFKKQKVVIVGHSWGTVVGLRAAIRKPEWVAAYVGIGQVINFRDNEIASYELAMARAKADNNREAMKDLESIAPYPGDKPLTRDRIGTERKWAQYYGGLSAYRQNSAFYFNAPLLSPEYDQKDVDAIGQGSLLTLDRILSEYTRIDFTNVHKVSFPILMFMGRHDYTTPSAPTARWLDQVKTPYKKAVWFENSAHLVPVEEPGKTLLSLVNYVRPLAVAKR